MSAPRGNQNRTTHGMRSQSALTLAGLPTGCGFIRRAVGVLRVQLEQAAIAIHGELSLSLDSLVNLACRHEVRSMLASKWLRDHGAKMSPTEKLAMAAAVTESGEARDRCIRALKLDNAPSTTDDPWAALHATPRATAAPLAVHAAESPSNGEAQHNANGSHESEAT
jgi:hypothetical protein